MKLRVTQLRLEADGVISVQLRSPDGNRLPGWTAGAHVPVTLPSGTVRQYSLCGSGDDHHTYTIAVFKVDDGRGGSREVHEQLRIGDVIEVGEPRNDFELVAASRYLLLAGGIGITPILAMVEWLRSRPSPPQVTLLYGGRSRSAMAFTDRLAGLDFVRLYPQDEVGLPDIERAFADSPAGTVAYCCGPPAMLAAVREVSARHPDVPLHVEQFTAAAAVAAAAPDDGAFEVELARTGVTITVPPDRSVLDAVLEVAPGTPFSCTSGFCGTCETKVLSGRVDHRDELLSEDERQANTSMMICVSRSQHGAKLTLDL